MARDTLLDFFEDYFISDEPFIVHDDGYRVRAVSYRVLADAGRAFAGRLKAHGVEPDDRVVIWSENRAEWVAAGDWDRISAAMAAALSRRAPDP